jgi:hypothetical protein
VTIRQPSRLRHPSWGLLPATWRVITTNGTYEVMATTLANAILSGLELAGRDAQLIRCERLGEW